MAINSLNPILEPLTIIANIIKSDEIDEIDMDDIISINSDIIIISNLNSIKMIFLRHQHILAVLIIIINNNILIYRFSTSKVDIFIN